MIEFCSRVNLFLSNSLKTLCPDIFYLNEPLLNDLGFFKAPSERMHFVSAQH